MAMTFKQMRSCSIKGRKSFDDQRRQPGKLADMLLEYGNVLDMNSGADDQTNDYFEREVRSSLIVKQNRVTWTQS